MDGRDPTTPRCIRLYVAVDQSGNHNHGIIRGTTATADDACTGLEFPEERDRMTFPKPYTDAIDSGSFTILVGGQLAALEQPQTLWSYTSQHVNRRLAVRWDPGNQAWQFDFNGTTDRVQLSTNSTAEPGTPFQLAVTYEAGDGYRIFENGESRTQTRDVGDPHHEVCFLTLGATLSGQFPWQGTAYNLGVFDKALGEAELSTLAEKLC